MSDNKINVEAILKKQIPVLYKKVYSKDTRNRLKVAIKEIVDTALDECKKEILIAQKWRGIGPTPSFPRIIEKVRNIINYE